MNVIIIQIHFKFKIFLKDIKWNSIKLQYNLLIDVVILIIIKEIAG